MIQNRCLRAIILSFSHQERIMKNLTTGLSSAQQELDVLSQNLTYSKASQMSGLRNIWKSLNDSVEKTADLINQVVIAC